MGKDLNGDELGEGLSQEPSKMYRLRYRDNEGKRQTITMRSLKELRKEQRKILTALENGTYDDPKRQSVTLDEWFHIWIRRLAGGYDAGESTRAFYAEKYVNHIKPFLGDKKLSSIDTGVVRDWMGTLASEGRKEPTIGMAFRTLSACLGRKHGAESDGRLPRGNPCHFVRPPRPPEDDDDEREFTYVTEEDFDAKLLPAYADDEQMVRLILVASFTGLRFGELAGLRRRDVDLLAPEPRFRVAKNKYETKGYEEYDIAGGVLVGKPKGRRSRWVPFIPERALRALEEQLEICGQEPEDLVFPSSTGTHLDYHNWHKRWSKGMKKAGMPGLRPHDLRHSAATWLVNRGMSIDTLQRLLGHANRQMTERYIHTGDADVAAEMRKAWKPDEDAA